MSSTASAQRTFDFDMATLNSCIATLKPKPLRNLFRGLLLTAAMEPRRVTDIDDSGFLMMAAPIRTVAAWAGVSEKTIERGRDNHSDVVTHSAGSNTVSEWFFNLRSALPESAIDWFRDTVENSKMSPRQNENVAPTFCSPIVARGGDKMQNVAPNVGATFSTLSSMCLVPIKSKLASLAACCEKFGIAFAANGETWNEISIDPAGLLSPTVVEELYELAVESGAVARNATTRNRFFALAATSSRKETPWPYFRKVLTNDWLLTTEVSNADSANGRKLQRRADELKSVGPKATATAPPSMAAEPTDVPKKTDEELAQSKFGRFVLRKMGRCSEPVD